MKTEKKLKVGLVFDDTLDSSDGVSQQVKRLGEYLRSNGHDVVYLCGETKLSQYAGGKVYSLSKNIRVRFNGNRLSMPIYSSKRKIREALRTEKLDLVHITAPYSPFMAQRVVAEAGRQNLAIVGSFHILPAGWMSTLGARLLGLLQFFSLKKFDAFTSTSENAAKFAKKTMNIESVVAPNMVDTNSFLRGRKVGNTDGRIVFLGRLVRRKGCEQLIRAFARITQSKANLELIVAGDGPDRQKLENLAQKLGVAGSVKFLGYVSEEDKADILGGAQIACFPALYGESFGVVLIEAMAAGAGVVVGGNNPGYSSVLGPKPELLVDPLNERLFADRLVLLMGNNARAKKLHDWQLKEVKKYDIAEVGNQLLGIYDEAIALKSKTSHNKSHGK